MAAHQEATFRRQPHLQAILFIRCRPLSGMSFYFPSPAPDVGMKVSFFSALTGGLLTFVWTQAASGLDSDGTLVPSSGEVNGPPTVRTSSGLIVGHNAPNRPGVEEFLGIRFGRSPVGELRFAAPKAYTSLDTFVASHFVR